MDYGMPIVRGTGCMTGSHVWIVSGTSTKEAEIPPHQLCSCGMHLYDNFRQDWIASGVQNQDTERS